ncbi:LOW QUALITY PROTEIN: peripheral-type benzodiazepine receptor-associated protein 1 [Discoglossus pictus]
MNIKLTWEAGVNEINFLDLKITMSSEGKLHTTLFRKETSTNTILEWTSQHPVSQKSSIPFGQYLRLRRNCDTIEEFKIKASELKTRLKYRGYPNRVLKNAYKKALAKDRTELLFKRQSKKKEDKTRCILSFGTDSEQVNEIIKKHWYLISEDEALKNTLSDHPNITYRRGVNLGDQFVNSFFRNKKEENRNWLAKTKGLFRCGNCKACDYIKPEKSFHHPWTDKVYPINPFYNCLSTHVVYIIVCKCKKIYVGKTIRQIRRRILEHVYSIINKLDTPISRHIRFYHQGDIKSLEFHIIKDIKTSIRGGNIDQKLMQEECNGYLLIPSNILSPIVWSTWSILNACESSQPKHDEDMLNALRHLEQCCSALKEENILLRKSNFPETEEKVKVKRKNAELALIAKRLEERAHKLQEANLKMVNTPMHLKGASLEMCKKVFARQRAKDMSEQASALLAKDKQIEILKQECCELQAKLSAGKDFPSWLKLSDFDRLLRESQKEVLRLQRQIAVKYLKDLSRSGPRNSPPDANCIETMFHSDQSTEIPGKPMITAAGDGTKDSELIKKRKECEILEQEVKKKQKRCEELVKQASEVQTENGRLVEENSKLSDRINWTVKVESENADLREHLLKVTNQRDSAVKESHRLQSKLENLEQVLKHMRDVVERRQQLKKDHEDALIALQKRQEEVKRLQQAQVEAKKEHEGAVQLLEETLDSLQAKVKLLEEKCRSQTEQFSLLSQELERFRLQTGNIDLLTSTLVTSDLPPPQCCSTPGLPSIQHEQDEHEQEDPGEPLILKPNEKDKNEESENKSPSPLTYNSCELSNVEIQNCAVAKEKEKADPPRTPSKSESTHESRKSCPTPDVDTASEMEELEPDSVPLIPEPETRTSAKLQVFLARYSYNPFDGPNENPEAELPLTAGEYIYIYGDMDDDGFYEGELMDGRRGLVPSNFVERVSDDDLIAFHPVECNELSQSSGQDISFLSGSSIEKSEEDDDGSSLSPLPLRGSSEGAADISVVPYPRKLVLIKQLARSVVVSWEPPLVTAGSGNIQSYNIFVDHELRQNVRCGGQTKALIEKLELKTRTYRISVQSMTERGCSDRMRCTMLIGHGYSLAPTQLRVRSLSATSAEITWQPCNSNYSHALYLNEESCGVTKAGTYWFTFSSLRPSTMYNVKVEARPQRMPWEMPLERREQKTTVMQLTTPSAGPPDAPLDVQVELGPTPGVLLISWLPVTIDAAGTSNGVRVTGYAVYADGQKVLEVTSPTAGSVLVGMSHLQLLQVSREISVRTMSPSGESVDSVPAQIPSGLLKVSDFCSFLQPLSNTSLICEPASGQSMDSSPDRFPSMPLTSSYPCLPCTSSASNSEAKFSIHNSCSKGDVEISPVRISSQFLLSTINASSGFSQTSSSSESSEALMQQQNKPQSTINHLAASLPFSARTQNSPEVSSISLQEGETKPQKESIEKVSTTKESVINEQDLSSCLSSRLELGKPWSNDTLTEPCTTPSKEDCTSPEAGFSQETEDTGVGVCIRGASIEDFLGEDELQIRDSSRPCLTEESETSLPEDHAKVSNIEHSRSSNLSDILEEEEEEDEDSSAVTSGTKWDLMGVSTGGDSSGKPDCCETDSDEEILERILDLPLQKHCSKKLFSIPEVTEEEDEEEENCVPPLTKAEPYFQVETQKYQKDTQSSFSLETHSTLPHFKVNEMCEDLRKETNGKQIIVKTRKVDYVMEDCDSLNEEWNIKAKHSASQQQRHSIQFPVGCTAGVTKRNCPQNDRTHYISDSNRKRQSDAREHCSRLAANSNPTGNLFPRVNTIKEQVAYGIGKELSNINQKGWKGKTQKNSQRHPPSGHTQTKTKLLSSRSLEIDIEYDTEDDEDSFFTTHYLNKETTNILLDGSQTDQDVWSDCSSQSEPIQYFKSRRELKKQVRVHDVGSEWLKENTATLHSQNNQGAQDSSSDDPSMKLPINKSIRTNQWQCAGKVMFESPAYIRDTSNRDSSASLTPCHVEVPLASRKTRAGHLSSDTESEATQGAQSECCHAITHDKESPSKHQSLDNVRIFVALFDYEPLTMSPNPDAYEELPFKEGQILQVFGDKDADGFYRGECAGKAGYIPCNMVTEIYVQSPDIRKELVRQGCLTSPTLLDELGIRAFSPPSLTPPGRLAIPPPKPQRSKKAQLTPATERKNMPEKNRRTCKPDLSVPRPMVAIFDYNPRKSSPNMDVEAELSFTAGDIITVFGPMDEDGFYYGELKGQKGLVPSNFLEVSQSETEETASQEPLRLTGEKELTCDISSDQTDSPPEDRIPCTHAADSKLTSERQAICQDTTSSKKKKSLFSKGRKLFKKLGSSGKNL